MQLISFCQDEKVLKSSWIMQVVVWKHLSLVPAVEQLAPQRWCLFCQDNEIIKSRSWENCLLCQERMSSLRCDLEINCSQHTVNQTDVEVWDTYEWTRLIRGRRCQPLISRRGGVVGCAAEISKLRQLTLFILTLIVWVWGFCCSCHEGNCSLACRLWNGKWF